MVHAATMLQQSGATLQYRLHMQGPLETPCSAHVQDDDEVNVLLTGETPESSQALS